MGTLPPGLHHGPFLFSPSPKLSLGLGHCLPHGQCQNSLISPLSPTLAWSLQIYLSPTARAVFVKCNPALLNLGHLQHSPGHLPSASCPSSCPPEAQSGWGPQLLRAARSPGLGGCRSLCRPRCGRPTASFAGKASWDMRLLSSRDRAAHVGVTTLAALLPACVPHSLG